MQTPIRASMYHKHFATMIGMHDLVHPGAAPQFCKSARPGMKISGKGNKCGDGLGQTSGCKRNWQQRGAELW
jgi:hypothetical protein